MRLPKRKKRGDDIFAMDINDICEAIREITMVGGVGYTLTRSPGGTALRIKPGKGGGGGGINELVPKLVGTTVTVSSGYTDNMIPEIGGVALNASTAPTLTVSGATTLWELIDHTVVLEGSAPDKTIASTTAENARFVLATSQTEILPSTDGTNATDGLQAVRWADFISDGAGGYIMSTGWRHGSNQVTYCDGLGDYLMRFERVTS